MPAPSPATARPAPSPDSAGGRAPAPDARKASGAPPAGDDGAPETFRALAALQRYAPGHEGLERLAAELAARLAPDLARAAAPRLLGLLRRGAEPGEAEAVLAGLEPLLAEYGLVLGRRWRAARDGVFVFVGPTRPGAGYAGASARAVRRGDGTAGADRPPGPSFPPRLDIV